MNTPLTIDETHKLLLGKALSPVELVDTYLQRIKNFDKKINSFITLPEEEAYGKAKNLEKLLSTDGERVLQSKPLFGVVMSLKDIYLTKGVRTTAASKVLENYIPAYSGTVVNKLEDAGAIIIGKTNCDAWAHGSSGENSDFGPTLNPWDVKAVPGGSSSGSAVSVASNFCLSSMGTDTGGSVRLPASFCNVVGFKPTYGVVSRYGVVAMASSLDSMGHFTHTVSDSEKIFEITKGVDNYDGTLKENSLRNTGKSSKLKIGLPKEYFVSGLDKEVEKNIQKAIEVYKGLGHEMIEVSLPMSEYVIAVYYIVMTAEVASNLGRYDGVRYGSDRTTFGEEAKRRIMLGTYVLSSGYYDAYYLKAMQVRTKISQDFEKAFEKVDAILSPVSPTLPPKIGEKVKDPLQMYLMDVFTVAANLAGIPGISIPCGFSENGLPIGFQLLGPRFGESTLFKLGKDYQKTTDIHLKRPNLK